MPNTSKPSSRTNRTHSPANSILKRIAAILLVLCAALLVISLWPATANPASHTDADPTGQVTVEPGAQPSQDELDAAEYLAGHGHRVRLLRRDPASTDPQPDTQLDDDDFPTEIKTVSNLTGSNVAASLSRRIREGLDQAPSVVVDAREQNNLTLQTVEEGMKHAVGKADEDGKVIKRIRVIGPNGIDVNWDYT